MLKSLRKKLKGTFDRFKKKKDSPIVDYQYPRSTSTKVDNADLDLHEIPGIVYPLEEAGVTYLLSPDYVSMNTPPIIQLKRNKKNLKTISFHKKRSQHKNWSKWKKRK